MASRQHKLFYGSSYDRGIQYLLYMWPEIKQAYPDAELHIAYGWELFDMVAAGNPERRQWKRSVEALMKQPGIFHYGRIGKEELKKVRSSCGIWAYPTEFEEINCITALDCQNDGLVPVTMAYAALVETAKEGILVKGDIKDEQIQKNYLKELLSLMGDEKKWKIYSNKCKRFTNKYHWTNIADQWVKYFKEPIIMPKVSVITPTIREGFWRIMAENLSKQTYKDIEWIIVDDYKENREEIAKKYAKTYNLDIKYLRGNKTRKCGLVAANNIAWKSAKGELLVWLQDFIMIPDNGIEMLVDLYRHNQDAILAPVDIYYDCIKPDTTNKEDWFCNIKENWFCPIEDILTKESWRNCRVKNEGIRESDDPHDFEMNYGAIPRKILEELNGFWEFMDDGLGYDNLELCYRAMKLGYRLVIDDTNVCKCINLWPIIGGTSQNILSRERMLNPPRWEWLLRNTEKGILPIKRDAKIDNSISLPFEVPKEVKDKDCAIWIRDHIEEIIKRW